MERKTVNIAEAQENKSTVQKIKHTFLYFLGKLRDVSKFLISDNSQRSGLGGDYGRRRRDNK